MKKITFLLFALVLSIGAYAQCPAGAGGQYPGTNQVVNNDGLSNNISTCNYSTEYSLVDGFTIGEDYQISIVGGGVDKYATIVDAADGTTVLTHGASPLMWTATVANVQINWSDDAACAGSATCHTTSYINLTQAPSCPDPTGANATNVTETTADLGWEASGTTNWDIEWGADGFTPTGTPNVNDTADNPYTLMGLTGETAYDYYVRADCGMDDTSDVSAWVGPISFTTLAPAPANDECDAAIALVCDTPLTGSTSTATDSGGNPAGDVWFVYDNAGVTEDVTVSLCGSAYDTLIRIYADCPATTQIASNDDFCDGTRSQVTFTNDGTQAYYIMVEGYNTSTGDFNIVATCDVSIPAPANDNCDAAEALTIGVPASGTTAGATDQGTGPDDDTTCDPFDFHADVWYSVTLTGGPNDLTVTTTIPGGSTSTEAGVAIYPAECDFLDASSLACAGGDSATGGTATATGLADGTYYIRVWSDGVAARVEGTFDVVADATLSTRDFDNGLAFSYYPNPVNDNLALTAQKDIQNVSVYNMLGQEVVRTAPNAANTEVNMSALQAGAYFVKVTINDVTETVRVIKN